MKNCKCDELKQQLAECQKERDELARKVEYWRDTAKEALESLAMGEQHGKD